MSKTVKLGDICDFINGGAWSDKEYVTEGIPVLKVSNFKPSGFVLDDVSRLPTSSLKKYEKNILRKGDLIIATVGSHPNLVNSAAGRSCVVTDEITGYLLNQNAVCIKTLDPEVLDQRYLTYFGKSYYFQHYIQSCGRGAANQMRIAISSIKDYEVNLPDIKKQRSIASILSAYDDLIENNQKQIKILEEAAMRLYKEWFVNLHFPEHENTSIVDSVPEGWSYETLGSIAINSGKKEKKENRNKYSCYLPIDCIPKKSLACIEYNSVTEAESSLVAFTEKDILFGSMRPYFHKVIVSPSNGLTRTTCFVINSKEPQMWAYLVMLMFSEETVKYATQISVGTTMPYVRWNDMINMPVLIPDKKTVSYFQTICNPMIQQIITLAKQIGMARVARDKFLPKLMSGEIEV